MENLTVKDLPKLLEEARIIARMMLSKQPGHVSLLSSDLVNLTLVRQSVTEGGWDEMEWSNLDDFLRYFRTTARSILVDYSRIRNRKLRVRSRMCDLNVFDLGEILPDANSEGKLEEFLDLKWALLSLAKTEPKSFRLLEMTMIMGFSRKEAADALGYSSVGTFSYHLRKAKGLLELQLCSDL